MCITTYQDNSQQAKSDANCGTPRIWVGFADVHSVGTYHINNPKITKKSDKGCDIPKQIVC